MARLLTQVQQAATGLDLTSDPVSMALSRARRLINLQLTRPGVLYTNVALRGQFPASQPYPILGVMWYYNAAVKNNPFLPDTFYTDLLLWVMDGFLFRGVPGANPLTDTVQDQIVVPDGITGYTDFGPFFRGKRVRFFALGEEVIAVQEGGILPLRFYFSSSFGTGFYRAGFDPPISDAGSPGDNLTLTATGTGLTGTYTYKVTFADERFRESSPTPGLDITVTNQGVKATLNNIGYQDAANGIYNGSHYVYAYLYRNTLGVPDTFYQIARHTIQTISAHSTTPLNPQDFTTGDFYYDAAVAYDNAPDADITADTLAPNPGENDPPLPASVGCVHKNYVFLNSISDPNTLQVSNQGSPTQFASLPVVATDGGRFQIGTDQGNIITAIVEFGSVLAIFKRRGAYFLYGDTIADFIVRPIHQRGCVAPDSCVRCDNVVCFLSDDGVYAAAYEGGDTVTKISKEIEALLLSLPQSTFETACAFYVDYRYHLMIGDSIFVYDFYVQGWTNYIFGSGTLSLGAGMPDVEVTAGVGFGNVGNSALYGSIVPCGGSDSNMDGGPCDVAVTPTSLDFTGDGGTQSLTVTPSNSTATPYVSYALWLGINGPQFGPGTATVSCEPNPTCHARFGVVQVCQTQIAVSQEPSSDTSLCPCAVTSLTPDSFSVDYHAQTVTTNYVLSSAAAVSPIVSFVPWLHPHAAVVGTPTTGHVDIDIDENDTCQDRTGMVQICDMLVTISQGADPACGCNVTITPDTLRISPGLIGSGSFQVTNLAAGAYTCDVDNPAAVQVTNCPGNSGAGVFNCTFNFDGTFFNPVTDGVVHITLCNAVFTIVADQHS